MRTYLIVIERAGIGYSAYAPDLAGCVATGKTVAETEQTMRGAIELHIEGLREDGEPVPEPEAVAEYVTIV